jgi:hypothetical protein
MAFRHGRHTVVTIDGTDLSTSTNSTDFNDGTDSHDVTCYGASRKAYHAGLGDGKITISGVHNDDATGPRAVLKPLKTAGSVVPFVFRPEGTGSGKAQSAVDVIVVAYNESAPVADMIKWTAELQMSGDLDETDQS